jgi:hypothetical protein
MPVTSGSKDGAAGGELCFGVAGYLIVVFLCLLAFAEELVASFPVHDPHPQARQ